MSCPVNQVRYGGGVEAEVGLRYIGNETGAGRVGRIVKMAIDGAAVFLRSKKVLLIGRGEKGA